ncbi:MAG: tRNA (adenosine(37)-N6)-threonylcarbamoyltransferase complex ATPase subunit type 1 TsaE [Oscillospiraceae bacterium]|nr:tRNA (adenosine(37)-N6)-threonylcarbamoyltransferase complex ATPase subunit type 1 TsaE [Oscillospiraceae bacterium]
MKTFFTKSEDETENIGQMIAKELKPHDVIALFGDLGAGKTAFVRGLARGLGVKADVSSPTFSLVHDYGGVPALYHFDMYRVSTWEDLCSTGFFDYLDLGGILAVEWSENIETQLPKTHIRVEIQKGESDDERTIIISGDSIK